MAKRQGPPPALTTVELGQKLEQLRKILAKEKKNAIYLHQEGALRWLTGYRNQITDIAPGAESPVKALVAVNRGRFDITFVTTPFEMPRIKDQFPEQFSGLDTVSVSFSETVPRLPAGTIKPSDKTCGEITGAIIRPLLGGLEGNQYRKLRWLANTTTVALYNTARSLKPGMNGFRVYGLMSKIFYTLGLESNLFLVALAGQENHLHPLYHERYRVEKKGWIKLVVGTRFADMIYSGTVMVKMGGTITEDQALWHQALRQGLVEYADCYRKGKTETRIYEELGARFREVEKDFGLKGFAKAAYLHHPGGPTSPLGNRDYIIQKKGKNKMFPWIQFALNPVEHRYSTKAELQGMVMPDGPPRILDPFEFTARGKPGVTEFTARSGTRAKIADIITR